MAPELPPVSGFLEALWIPITSEEIKNAYPPTDTAVGLDLMSYQDLRSLPVRVAGETVQHRLVVSQSSGGLMPLEN